MAVRHIDDVGRKNMQLCGFAAIAVLFLICGLGHDWFLGLSASAQSSVPLPVRQAIFLVLYSLTFSFSNFGPNTTTFLIPGEIYPSKVRATCHGFSAAMGKAGAAVGAFFFPSLLATDGLSTCMLACSGVAVAGAATTFLLTPAYDAADLVEEGAFLPLEHACLRSGPEEQALLGGGDTYRHYKYCKTYVLH
jgi:PHS family inorganic phosphate transporter-like MFS transporter